jgi:tetratricopeptide (TPR) repeat protein
MSRTLVAVLLSAVAAAVAWPTAAQGRRSSAPLDAALTAYAGGDHAVVGRVFARSLDFQAQRLTDRRRLDRFLNPWQRTRAAFLLELANQSSHVAPAYSLPLLAAGRAYVARRPDPPGTAPLEDAFERLWHQTASGILQRRQLAASVEEYVGAVLETRAASDPLLRARLLLGLGIAQEQRCWLDRPVLVRAGTPVQELNRSSQPSGRRVPERRPGTKPDVSRRLDCLAAATERFAAAAASGGETAAEARIRLAWSYFQLGSLPEAMQMLEAPAPEGDPELRYLSALFRGRVAQAMRQEGDAERAYREALAISPRAQAAGIGLALTLFAMDRRDEANAAAASVRTRQDEAPDPWWTYLAGDSRFVDHWIRQLRGLL